MRVWRLIFALAVVSAISAQTPDLPMIEADAKDEAFLEVMLHRQISTMEIYKSPVAQDALEKEANDLVAAAQRRVSRAEANVERAKEQVAQGVMPHENLRAQFAEVQKRLDVLTVVIFRSGVLKDIVRTARAERLWTKRRDGRSVEKFQGNGTFSSVDFKVVSRAFLMKFGRTIPVSAAGSTSTHRAMGFDHRGRVDVAIAPDSQEGVWLRSYLETLGIPFYAFRTAMSGSATAPHIHIGPGSQRVGTEADAKTAAPRRGRAKKTAVQQPASRTSD